MPSAASVTVRRARPKDRDALRRMQAHALRVLGAGHYSSAQIEAYLAHVGTMDDFLLREGTYHLAEVDGQPVASGGWSRRRPAYAATGPVHADSGAPKIRSVFVHPDWARRGLARRLMALAEMEAQAAGHAEIELTAMLPGVPLYEALGYVATGRVALALPGGVEMPAVTMRKPLAPPASMRTAG